MDVNRGDNIFQLFGEQQVAQPQVIDTAEKAVYYACGMSENDNTRGNEEWFRVHLAGGAIELCRYADILNVYCPVHQLLIILCETCIFELEGQYLDVVLLLIQDRSLRALYLFEPEQYEKPNDREPMIRQIDRQVVFGE